MERKAVLCEMLEDTEQFPQNRTSVVTKIVSVLGEDSCELSRTDRVVLLFHHSGRIYKVGRSVQNDKCMSTLTIQKLRQTFARFALPRLVLRPAATFSGI